MLKLTSPSARSIYFSCTIFAVSCKSAWTILAALYRSRASYQLTLSRSSQCPRSNGPSRPPSSSTTRFSLHVRYCQYRVASAHPFELMASTKAIKCVSTSRSVGTALWPAWAAAVCADSKKVASSSRCARSSAADQGQECDGAMSTDEEEAASPP